MTYYCLIDFLALLVLLITNNDSFYKNNKSVNPQQRRYYSRFLLAVIAYYLSDMAWAWLYDTGNLDWLYVDTEIYFLLMALGVVLWSHYVVVYLGIKNAFSKFMTIAATVLFVMVIVAIPLNRLWGIMFWFDGEGVYHAGTARDVIFIYQAVFLLMSSVYTLLFASYKSKKQRQRNYTVGLAGMIMLVFVAVQVFFPTYPLYAISYMMGCCLIRTFVIENERDEYREHLEIALERELEQFHELRKAWNLAYKDALTGVKSKLAYAEKRALVDSQITKRTQRGLAVAVMDVNDLKVINDTLGHDVGDEYIKTGCRLICEIFKKSPVYRVGGDEFVAILEGDDYERRETLLATFNREIEKNRQNKGVIIAIGMSAYNPNQDDCYKQIFERADTLMYQRKKELKGQEAG